MQWQGLYTCSNKACLWPNMCATTQNYCMLMGVHHRLHVQNSGRQAVSMVQWKQNTVLIITGTRAMPRVVNGQICVQGPSINVCKWVFTTAYMYNTGIHKPWWVFTNAYMYHTGIDKPLMYVNGWSPPPPTCTKQWKHKPKPCHLHWLPLCHVLCNRHCMVLARVMHLTTL